jgi:hypothetical protein
MIWISGVPCIFGMTVLSNDAEAKPYGRFLLQNAPAEVCPCPRMYIETVNMNFFKTLMAGFVVSAIFRSACLCRDLKT